MNNEFLQEKDCKLCKFQKSKQKSYVIVINFNKALKSSI